MQRVRRTVLLLSVLIQLAGNCFHRNYRIYAHLFLNSDCFNHYDSSRKYGVRCLNMQTVDSIPTSTIKLSPMVENMAISKTIQIHAMTKELEKAGKEVLSLCVGEPDYQPPKVVLEATVIFVI